MLFSKIIGEGFPVILIHGLFGMGDNLAMVARPLAERFQVHSLDLRNHGRSPRADSMAFRELADDVLAYMDFHRLERAHILGHSLGGKVAMQTALSAPHRVARLIVADISPVAYTRSGHDDVFAALNAVVLADIQSRRDAESALAPYLDEPAVKLFILKNLYRNDSGKFDWRMNLTVLQRCYEQMRSGVDADRPFEGEVLFLKGSDSPYIQEQHWDAIERLFPKAQLKVIQGAGHWLHAEKSVVFNQLVENFLSEN